MKNLLVLPFLAMLGGCVVNPYSDTVYSETVDYQYVPAGSSMIYTETVTRPQVIYTESYPVYVNPRPYYRPAPPRPYWNNHYNDRPRGHYNGRPHNFEHYGRPGRNRPDRGPGRPNGSGFDNHGNNGHGPRR